MLRRYFAVARCRFKRRAHARQDILLNHDPTVVTDLLELGKHAREIDIAPPQLGEDALPYRLRTIPFMQPRLLVHGRVVIFEMHVPDALGKLADAAERIAAAECPVAGVEYKPDDLIVGHIQDALGFGRGLDPGAGVMMQHRAQAGFVHHAAGGMIGAGSEDAPALGVQAHRRCDAPGIQAAHGIGVGVGPQHHQRIRSADGGQQFRSSQASFGAFFMPVRVLEIDIDPRPQHLQVARCQLGAQLPRVGHEAAHESPRWRRSPRTRQSRRSRRYHIWRIASVCVVPEARRSAIIIVTRIQMTFDAKVGMTIRVTPQEQGALATSVEYMRYVQALVPSPASPWSFAIPCDPRLLQPKSSPHSSLANAIQPPMAMPRPASRRATGETTETERFSSNADGLLALAIASDVRIVGQWQDYPRRTQRHGNWNI